MKRSNMQVSVANDDITKLSVDAIVYPSNSQGTMDEGLGLHIKTQGGEGIEEPPLASAPLAIGAAIVTTAGRLPAKKVIHVPTINRPGEFCTIENLRRAVRAALIASAVNKFSVIAVPGMGFNEEGVPHDEGARAVVEEIRAHKKEFPATIYLVDTDPEVLEAFEGAFENALHG